jgi:hypothetical protein
LAPEGSKAGFHLSREGGAAMAGPATSPKMIKHAVNMIADFASFTSTSFVVVSESPS